eukprot:356046-Chlamydomonas_euryale.AAC.3
METSGGPVNDWRRWRDLGPVYDRINEEMRERTNVWLFTLTRPRARCPSRCRRSRSRAHRSQTRQSSCEVDVHAARTAVMQGPWRKRTGWTFAFARRHSHAIEAGRHLVVLWAERVGLHDKVAVLRTFAQPRADGQAEPVVGGQRGQGGLARTCGVDGRRVGKCG